MATLKHLYRKLHRYEEKAKRLQKHVQRLQEQIVRATSRPRKVNPHKPRYMRQS